uniref:Uncharacterized protein n=1 Tax=Kalanchoe fedtschenkoi TaxID=63787 RepID=A0A7N0VEV2_KALFE
MTNSENCSNNVAGNRKRESMLTRIVKTPLRILVKARDLYMKTMEYCDGRVSQSTTYVPSSIPRSFSVRASSMHANGRDDDCRELIRVASRRGRLVRVDGTLRLQQPPQPSIMPARSYSVRPMAIQRIDEDETSEFVEDYACARSRSCAVERTRGGFF